MDRGKKAEKLKMHTGAGIDSARTVREQRVRVVAAASCHLLYYLARF